VLAKQVEERVRSTDELLARGVGARLASRIPMKRSAELVTDMMTLARLHAALDSVVDIEQLITQVHESSMVSRPTIARVGALVAETRELLRHLLAPPHARHAVGNPASRREPDDAAGT
jgi:hypothetical protein